MAADGGFITLHRQLQEHWIADRPEHLAAWLDLLMLVNWQDRRVVVGSGVVTEPRGSRLASERFLQQRWKRWGFKSRMMVRTFLRLLESDEMIERTEISPRATMLTVCNYDSYQRSISAPSPQKAHKKPTSSPQVAQREEGKEGEEVLHVQASPAPRKRAPRPDIPEELLRGVRGFADLWGERMRNANRKPKPSAEAKQLASLVALLRESGPEAVRRCVEEASRNGYQGIFPGKFSGDGKPNGKGQGYTDTAGNPWPYDAEQVAADFEGL